MKTAPDIVLAGFGKSGTTTLADQLVRMPEIDYFIKGKKEPHTFLVEPKSTRLKEEMGRESNLLLDASTSYSLFPEALERIAKRNKNALVIFILRDPIDLTESHMRWLRRLESRTIPFDLQFNLVGVKNKQLYSRKGYYLVSLEGNYYAQTILHAKELFPEVMTLYFDDLVNNQTQVIQEIRRRLRLPELAEALEPIASNVTSEQVHVPLTSSPVNRSNALQKARWSIQALQRSLYQDFWLRVRYCVVLKPESEQPIDERMAQKIYNSIRDDVANYPKAGIAVSRFPTLSKFVNGNGTASE